MKIGSSHDMPGTAPADLARTARTGSASPVAPVATDQVEVSAAAAQLGSAPASDFDAAKVDAIRQAIREGRFRVNAGAIAERLIADAAAMVGPRNA